MNLEALGNVGEFIGALAVILSILYLARQVKQSSLLARAESQRALLNSAHLWHPFATTPGLTHDFREGLNRYSELDPDTQARFNHLIWPFINHVEAVFRMYRQGLMEYDSYERYMVGVIGIINTPGGGEWWEHVGGMFGPEFVEALEVMRENSETTYTITEPWHFYRPLPEDAE